MDGIFLLLLAFLSLLVVRTRLKSPHYYKKVKLLPMISVMVYMLLKGFVTDSNLAFEYIALGVLLGSFGDYYLLFKERKRFLIAGLIFFLLGHIFYTIAFFQHTPLSLPVWQITLLVLPGFLFFLYLAMKMRQNQKQFFIVPVAIYFMAIVVMLVAAVNFGVVNHPHGRLAIAGAVLFTISDSALGLNIFLHYSPLKQAIVLLSYYSAQGLIVLSSFR